MTYIEFFDKTAVENICACLTKAPTRVIFIGDKGKEMKKAVARYARVMEDRGHQVEFIVKTVNRNNLGAIITELSKIVEKYDNCCFDLTGGEDLYLVAAGAVRERYPEKNIQMHWFNLKSNTIADCDQDGTTIMTEPPHLTVEEQVRIYGGDVVYDDEKPLGTHRWDMNSEFCEDIHKMWDICCRSPRRWNTLMGVLVAAQNVAEPDGDPLVLLAQKEKVVAKLAEKNHYFLWAPEIMRSLFAAGLLTSCDCNETTIRVAYKNEQVRRLMGNAGKILEMKIYALARELTEPDGKPVYGDVMTGVCIDWDGNTQDAQESYDTVNEIDVVLMRNMVPVFVSCKNGRIDHEELYKLVSVTERFGGKYARKVLIANSLDPESDFCKHLSQRAADMGIILVPNIYLLEEEALSRLVRNFWTA